MWSQQNELPPYLQSWQCSPVHRFNPMCKQRPADSPTTDLQGSTTTNTATSSMDVHILLDVLTLCAVALLVLIFIVAQVTKRRRQLQSTKTTGTQTSNIVPDLDTSIYKITSELTSLQDRMEMHADDQLLQAGDNPAQPERGSPCPDRGRPCSGEDILARSQSVVPVFLTTNSDVSKSNNLPLFFCIVVMLVAGKGQALPFQIYYS